MDEPDPFAFLITRNCHVTASQERFLRASAFVRHHDRFPDESDSQYYIPVETNGIRMESPPEDEFLTPQEDSLPPASSSDGESAQPMNFLRDLGPPLAAAVDLGRDSDSLGFRVGKSTVVIESGDLGRDTDEFIVVERKTKRIQEICTEPERKKIRVSEGLEAFKGASVGTVVVDWDEDQVFDKMPMRNKEVKMGVSESTSFEAADLDEDRDNLVREQGSKMRLSENIDTQFVDLVEDCDKEQESKLGPVEVTGTQVVDIYNDEACDDVYMNTEVVDLNKIGICDDLPMTDRDAKFVCNETTSTEVVDLDEDELYGDSTMRNLEGYRVVSKKVVDPKGDENILFGDDIEKIDNVAQKGTSIGGYNDTYDKSDEMCRDVNIEFAKKSIDISLDEGDGCNIETKGGPVEKNTNKLDKSNCGDQTGDEKTKSDQIMKNLLDALDLITEDKKEKMGDDVADGGLDFWETAMLRGMRFPHPPWWPPQDPND